ncbi:MAG TPA: type VI secretion system-associated FHA domain protein TagH [Planctomycetota bacterium]|jgi:type VI secretion system FHA domain protein|nr:type VI secretion system-associated FHA domain protein TagH [Planctomycetota bacterium]
MTSFKLVITLTTMKGKPEGTSEYLLQKEKTFIGRSPGNDIVLPDAEKRVSSKHARVDRTPSSIHFTDLGSTNGTIINGRKIEANSAQELKGGDKVMIGLYQVSVVASEEELSDQTMVVIDPARQLAHLTDELPILYARHAESTPEQRRKMMRGMIQAVISTSGPENARSILTQLKSRFQTSERSVVPERTTTIRRKDLKELEAKQAESAAAAGLRVLQDLSVQFVGEEKLETPEQAELFAKMVASVLELTFDWISKSLRGRKEFEEQFSADLSMIFAKEKNPLKGGGGPADMGRYLLDWRLARDPKTIRDSLDNAFKDLTMHQLGLLAGVQESLSAVLKRLDPATVEQEAKGVPGLFTSTEKKAWKRYSDVFHEIFAENSKLFNELIYPNVRKGYLALHDNQEKEKAAGIKKGDTSTRASLPSPASPSLTRKDTGEKTGG